MTGPRHRLLVWALLVAGLAPGVVSAAHAEAFAGPPPTPAVSAVQACALQTSPAPVALGAGAVESFIDRATAQALIERTQAQAGGKIDPDYVDNLRVAVRMDDGSRATVLVPKAMAVRVGDRVTVESSYRNAQLPCNYIPNLVTADLGPAPAQISSAPSSVPSQTVACTLQAPPVPNALGSGTVASFIDRTTAQALIGRTQAQAGGKIDPGYVDNLRVVVTMDDGGRATVIIPMSMAVRVGDRVAVQSSYRSAQLPCNYVPNLVTADLGPSPAP